MQSSKHFANISATDTDRIAVVVLRLPAGKEQCNFEGRSSGGHQTAEELSLRLFHTRATITQ